ncbi:MAG TPA: Fic family protein [Acidimicrobiales bacterium]
MRTVTREWEGRPVQAAWPEPLADAEFELSGATMRAVAAAEVAVAVGRAAVPGAAEVSARLLLRAEGLSSSMIEGLRVTSTDLALAEADPRFAVGDAGWVSDNLAVVTDALATPGPLTTDLLFEWHRRLMRHAHGIAEAHVGTWRDRLGWVGGANPLVAAHVATPPELIDEAMADLVVFANRTDVDPVTAAAVIHAQFETIHPFADGNGRIGRVLIGRALARGTGTPVPPPVSTQFARDIGGYLSGLALYQQGLVDGWVRWFAGAVSMAAERASLTLGLVGELHDRWLETCADLRKDSAAWRLLAELASYPVLDSSRAARIVGVSERAARGALAELGDRGVVVPVTPPSAPPGGVVRWWAAVELLDLVGG